MKIRSRIERLEDDLLPLPAGPTLRLNINAVESDGKVVDTIVFEVPQPAPDRRERRYRGLAARRTW